MKKLTFNQKNQLIFLFILTLIFAGCYEFEFVNQPKKADLDSSFEVPISVLTTDGDSTAYYRSFFTVQLPEGWTVSDSIYYNDETQNGYFIYSDSITSTVDSVYHPPEEGYKWMVFQSSDSILHYPDANFYFTPIFNTDSIAGTYYIDYYLGDDEYGVFGYDEVSSKNNLITVGLPDTITVTNNSDNGPGSLREAIENIAIEGLITFDFNKNQIIQLDSTLVIYKDIEIAGPDEYSLTISGNDKCLVFSVDYETNLSISNLTIAYGNNYNGGGINLNSNAIIEAANVSFVNNYASGYGGGIYCNSNSKVSLSDVTFLINHAERNGGGFYASSPQQTDILFNDVLFEENSAGGNGGGMLIDYGSVNIHNTLFFNNNAINGGGIYINRGAVGIINSKLDENNAEHDGGGVYINQADLLMINTHLVDNESYRGGGIYSFYSDLNITNSLFASNKSANSGAGLYCKDISNTVITNSTFTQNNAIRWGGGIMCERNVNLLIRNGIHYINEPNEIYFYEYNNNPCHIDVAYTNLEGGEEGIITNENGTINWLDGNIDENPLFVYSGDFPYQINDYSPCIDAGTPDTTGLNLPEFDLAGEFRFSGSRVDMGAYEWNMMVGSNEFEKGDIENSVVTVFPNPIQSDVTIKITNEQTGIQSIEIYNATGVTIQSLEFTDPNKNEYTIGMECLKPGIYFLRLQIGDEVETKKIVKL